MKIKLLSLVTATVLLSACSNSVNVVKYPSEQFSIKEVPLPRDEINLTTDALFKFGKHSRADLLEQGKISLNELATKINAAYSQINKIKVTGHTDRLGSEKANYTLGLKRAETVKSYLQQYGIKQPIEVASAGESQPVTTNCIGEKATKQLTACLQPDRRVTVEIEGLKRQIGF